MTVNEILHEIPHMRFRLEATRHKEVLDELEEMVKHHKIGHWSEYLPIGGYKCSVCGGLSTKVDDYCSYCWAKMESELKDENT